MGLPSDLLGTLAPQVLPIVVGYGSKGGRSQKDVDRLNKGGAQFLRTRRRVVDAGFPDRCTFMRLRPKATGYGVVTLEVKLFVFSWRPLKLKLKASTIPNLLTVASFSVVGGAEK
ncbi:hypothetical protein RUND412_010793 [Rhizina undulata]